MRLWLNIHRFLPLMSSWDFPTHPKLLWHINLFQMDLFTRTPTRVPLVFQIDLNFIRSFIFSKAVPLALLMKLWKVTIYCYEWQYEQYCDLFQWIINTHYISKGHNQGNMKTEGHNLVLWPTLWTILWTTALLINQTAYLLKIEMYPYI